MILPSHPEKMVGFALSFVPIFGLLSDIPINSLVLLANVHFIPYPQVLQEGEHTLTPMVTFPSSVSADLVSNNISSADATWREE